MIKISKNFQGSFSMSDRTPSVWQFKFISVASHLNLLFLCLELVFTSYTATFQGFVILKFSVVSYVK